MAISNEEYAQRRDRLGAMLEQRGIDALFVPPSSDLEYLTGIERDLPSFGNLSYAHGWVAGAVDGSFGVRVEDVIEVVETGGRVL